MIKKLIISSVIIITLAGCINNSMISSDIYSASDTKQIQSVTYGTLIGIRPVKIQSNEDSNLIGTLGGAIFGGLLGNTIGSGTGHQLATAVGTLAGGTLGSHIEGSISLTSGFELEIRKDDNTIVMVVQKKDDTKFIINQKVALTSNGRIVTVSPR